MEDRCLAGRGMPQHPCRARARAGSSPGEVWSWCQRVVVGPEGLQLGMLVSCAQRIRRGEGHIFITVTVYKLPFNWDTFKCGKEHY